MTRKAILIVDDDAIILMALKQALRLRFGETYLYETAMDGAKGLYRIAALSAEGIETALVISDWFMPGMDGEEFLMKVHEAYPEIRLIMLTGHADEADLARLAENVEIEAALRKPWDPDELYGIISGAMG